MNELFSAEEYRLRLSRAREAMTRHGLDALFVTAETNVAYFSGYRPLVPWATLTRANFALIPGGAEPVLLVHKVWHGGAAADAAWADVRSFQETGRLPLDTLVECFRDHGLQAGRIGLELGNEQRLGMAVDDLARLRGALPGVDWVDGAAALWDVRTIKSPAEIASIRRACQITDAAFDACFSRLSPDMTEAELASNLQSDIAARGAEFGFMAPCFVPESYSAMSRLPGSRKLQPGALIWADLGAVYHGYWSDFGRAAVMGRATDRQRRLWEGVHQVTQAGLAAVRPGCAMTELVAACTREAERLKLEMNFASGRIGHGLGMLLTEPPHVAAYASEELKAGMVITLEPGIVSPEGVYIVEQDIAVTESGAEVLSDGRWQIWEI